VIERLRRPSTRPGPRAPTRPTRPGSPRRPAPGFGFPPLRVARLPAPRPSATPWCGGIRDLGPAPAAFGARALRRLRWPSEFDVPASDTTRSSPSGLRDRRGGRPTRAPSHRNSRASPRSTPSSSSRGACASDDARRGTRLLPGRPSTTRYRRVVGDAILGASPPRTSSSSTSTRRGRAPTPTSRRRSGCSASARSVRPRSRRAARALVRPRRPEDAHPAGLQPAHRGRARGEEGRASVPLHGGAGRAVAGPRELVSSAGASTPCPACGTRSCPRPVS